MSEVKVNKISPRSGTTVTLGDSGDTITLASGVSLTGVNATFSGDLTVDTNTLYVDSANNEVGIGTTSPSDKLNVYDGAISVDSTSGIFNGTRYQAGSGSANINLYKSRTNTIGDHSALVNEDNISAIISRGSDGTSFIPTTAIFSKVDGSVSTNSIPSALIFSTNGGSSSYTERMRIDSSGNVGIGTTSPSQALDVVGSIEVSDSIYLGGTGSANALDDYETGTWTPVYSSTGGLPSSVTYDRQNGYYYKIGGVVHIWWTLRTDAIDTTGMSGDLYVSGLPFTVGATVNDAVIAGGDAIVDNFLNDSFFTKTGALDNTTNVAFFIEGVHTGTDAVPALKNASNANSMYGHMTYFVDF